MCFCLTSNRHCNFTSRKRRPPKWVVDFLLKKTDIPKNPGNREEFRRNIVTTTTANHGNRRRVCVWIQKPWQSSKTSHVVFFSCFHFSCFFTFLIFFIVPFFHIFPFFCFFQSTERDAKTGKNIVEKFFCKNHVSKIDFGASVGRGSLFFHFFAFFCGYSTALHHNLTTNSCVHVRSPTRSPQPCTQEMALCCSHHPAWMRASHGWVSVNTHSTPVPCPPGKLWAAH